jgi:hypothetical protein
MKPKFFFSLVLLILSISLGYLETPLKANDSEILTTAALKEIRFVGDEFEDTAALEFELQNESLTRGQELIDLIRAKFKLVNGDLKMAKFYLFKIEDGKGRLSIIKNRYLAIITFIEGNFNLSLQYLEDKRFFDSSIYSQVCLLKLINFMAVNDNESLIREKDACLYTNEKSSKNEQYWLDTMIKLKLKDNYGVKKNLLTDIELTISDDEMSKLWLKTGLYLNKEKDLLKLISILPESSYQSKRLREIIAFMYLRSGETNNLQKALAFVDDIDTANAENIKGNINLRNKEYELAFGHFKLALQKKQDSTNSLDRAIPLAWILGQWNDGYNMLSSNTNKTIDPRKIKAIKIAFLIRDKKFAEAERELTLLKIEFQNAAPFEVNLMDSYVSLMMAANDKKYDKRKIEAASEKACQNFDGISCWISLQLISWKNLGKTITRDDEIFSDKSMTIDSLKENKPIVPLKETMSVDQSDIEELDGASIELMKVK